MRWFQFICGLFITGTMAISIIWQRDFISQAPFTNPVSVESIIDPILVMVGISMIIWAISTSDQRMSP